MTEQNQALVNQEAIEEARAMSGEANVVKFDFTPIIEIDNSMIEEELKSGRTSKVRVEPRFVFTTRNEASEYIKNPYENDIKGTVLKIRYMVDKKWKENDSTPYFRSNEFDSFQGQNVVLRSGEDTSPAYTYKQFKELYKERYVLWTIVYFLMDTEEGKKIFKLKMKGVSRGNFWDYMASYESNDSITLHETEVSFDVDDTGEAPFNYMCFKKTKNDINVQEALKFGRELRDALNSFNKPAEPKVEVVNEPVKAFSTPVEPVQEGNTGGSMIEKAMSIKKEETAVDSTPTPVETATEKTETEVEEKVVVISDDGKVKVIPF